MIKILFVDDDVAVLERLKTLIDWEAQNMRICGAFLLPLDALDFLEKETVDIVLSDISMPVMNGIAFASKLRSCYPKVKVIFLTAYEDFAYAHAAVRMGICNYLLKPIDRKELLDSIAQVCNTVNIDLKRDRYMSQLEDKARMNESFLRERFFQWLVMRDGECDDQMVYRCFQEYNVLVTTELYQVMILEPVDESVDVIHGNFFNLRVFETIRITLEDSARAWVFTDGNNRICLIFEHAGYQYSIQSDMEMIAKKLRDSLLLDLDMKVWIGFGEIRKGYANLRKGYLEAIYALKYNAFTGNNEHMGYSQIAHSNPTFSLNQHELRSDVIRHLRCTDPDAIRSLLNDVLKWLKNEDSYTFSKLVYTDLVIAGIIFMEETKQSMASVFGEYIDPLEQINALSSLTACHEWVVDFFEKLIASGNKGIDYHRKLAQSVLDMIYAEIGNANLSVKFLAQEFYVNQDHLNMVFKQVMGVPIKKCIIGCKMAHAKKLINTGFENVGGLAHAVGFRDALYFSKSFKKHFGIPPSEYITKCGH